MACQAIVRHTFLGMAIHTPAHGHSNKGLCRRFFALGNLSVAGLTLDLSQNDMTTMRIEDMIRLAVDLVPGDCLPLFCKLPDLLLFRTLGDRVFVTLQADGDIRHSGEGLGFVVPMARVTLQSLFHMLLVVKGDRLIRF